MRAALLSVFALLMMSVNSHAQIYQDNDTITLSVATEFEARQVAAEFCPHGGKHRITREDARNGNKITVTCVSTGSPAPRTASTQAGFGAAGRMTQPSARDRRPVPTPSSSAQPAQPDTNPITELSAKFRRALAGLSAAVAPQMPEADTELAAKLRRALTALSAAAQPEISAPDTNPPARPEDERTNTYAQAW